MPRQSKPLMLWLDLAFTPQDRELRVASARYFRLATTTLAKWVLQDVADLKPGALCFEFDQPDQQGLEALQDVQRAYPRLPVLMLTVQHSEALAVWAFRAGVWNYLVKPLTVAEFSENLKALAEIVRCGAPVSPRHVLAPSPPPELTAAPVDEHIAHLQPALHYVRRHFTEKITESEAARRCGMSRFAFSRSFHATFGMTFRDYVMRARISEARRLLTEGDRPVTDVALATGFTDGSYFARMFKRHTGVLPSQYTAGMAKK